MANITLRLRVDKENSQTALAIEYQSDPDALPHEHEKRHRAIVARVVEALGLEPHELGRIQVRAVPPPSAENPEAAPTASPIRKA